MNELTTINPADLAALATELGAKSSAGNGGQRVPVLRINRAIEDAEGRELPRGQMFLTGDNPVYATEVTFVPLSHHFQYSKYDSEAKKYTCWTRQIADWGDEPRDTKGTLRCGKPDSKTLNALGRDERAKYKEVKLVRLVRGLVSYTGKTIDGEEVTIENQPCLLKLSGQNNFQSGDGKPYAPFEEQFKKRIPKGFEMWNFAVTLTTKKNKNDTGDIMWYTFEYSFDATKPQPVTQTVYDSLLAVLEIVREENKKVDAAYMDAIRGKVDDLDTYTVLGDDLDDDLEDVA
jgi:hypothetical protein